MIKGLLSMRSAGAGLSVLRSRPTAGDGATPPFTTVHRLSSPFHHLSPPFHHLSTALHSLSPPFTSFHRLSPWCRCRHRSGGLCTQIGRCRSGTATASSRVGETPGITFGTASPCVFTAFRSIFTDIPPPFPDLPLPWHYRVTAFHGPFTALSLPFRCIVVAFSVPNSGVLNSLEGRGRGGERGDGRLRRRGADGADGASSAYLCPLHFHDLPLPLSLPFLLPFHCLPTTSHCLFMTLPLPIHCHSTASHCLPLPFHCLSSSSH